MLVLFVVSFICRVPKSIRVHLSVDFCIFSDVFINVYRSYRCTGLPHISHPALFLCHP